MSAKTTQLSFSAKFPFRSPPPVKRPSQREREYLRPTEVEAMIHVARQVGRHGTRDAAIILLMFRHGLRTAELVALKWSGIDLSGGYIEIRRVKHGHDTVHPLRAPELRALRQLQRDYPDTPYVFVSERKAPLSTRAIRHIIARAGRKSRNHSTSSSPSATSCLWLLSGELWSRYKSHSRLLGTQEYSLYRALHANVSATV